MSGGGSQQRISGALRLAPSRGRARRRASKWVKSGPVWLVFVIIVLAAGASVARLLRGRTVNVVRLQRSPIVQTVVTSGRVLPHLQVTLSALMPGSIQAVSVREGDHVRKGQRLVEIDPTEARAAVATAQARLLRALAGRRQIRHVTARVAGQTLEQARTRLEQAKLDYRRDERLFSNGATTRSALDDARAALDLARSRYAAAEAQAQAASPRGVQSELASAAVAQAQAELDGAKARLERTRVVAPSDGVVLTRSVEPGDVVQPGAPLLTFAGTGPTQLMIEPDERNLALLKVGQAAIASTEAFPARRFFARVAFIAPGVDPRRGTIEVKLDVDQPPDYLRPAMTVSVEVEVEQKTDVLTIDASAVRELASDKPWVLIVRDGTARRADVRVGIRGDRRVEIVSGVDAGALVIPPSERAVRPGTRVRARGG